MTLSSRLLVLLTLFATLTITPRLEAQDAARDTLRVQGLQKPVEIIRDRWGIAHIYASNEHDLFFAQGYNAAHDRLFQLELWRRQATGTVAEILGPRELQRDIGTRLFEYRGDMHRELTSYHPHGVAIVGAFVDGVNAYIDEAMRHPESLPMEFRLLGITPGKWTPAVVISRHQGLLGNIGAELTLGRAVAQLGPDAV
jgi:penicillin amidase